MRSCGERGVYSKPLGTGSPSIEGRPVRRRSPKRRGPSAKTATARRPPATRWRAGGRLSAPRLPAGERSSPSSCRGSRPVRSERGTRVRNRGNPHQAMVGRAELLTDPSAKVRAAASHVHRDVEDSALHHADPLAHGFGAGPRLERRQPLGRGGRARDRAPRLSGLRILQWPAPTAIDVKSNEA